MKIRTSLSRLLFAAVLCTCHTGFAEQRRDWMLDVQPGGTYLDVDAVFPGAQLTLEHRIPIYEKFNEIDLRVNSLLTVPYHESQVDLDVRVLLVTVGAGIGVNNTFRGHTFEPDEPISSAHRREREYDGDLTDETWWFTEGRVTLTIPLNDYVVFQNVNAPRYENRPARSFDWRTGVVHDGLLLKSEVMVFLKHREIGAFAPLVQLLNFDLDDDRHTVINLGYTLVTRPGFRRQDDILLLSMLFYTATLSDDMDIEDVYGFHPFFAPFTFSLVYRAVVDLNE
ncbi:MAG: hypothetical protein JXA30_03605 [Deltaproteobacteria bacterium]|nr:hypothetical protein [Deltaproteobacteria bacterium]